MPHRYILTLSAAALCLGVASCNKHNSKPNPPNDTATIGTLKINVALTYYGPQTELVVSEPGGKQLLDTVASNTGAPILASLKTNDTLVDVTQISPVANAPTTIVTTYKSINLARLSALGITNFSNIYKRPTSSTASHILYYNIPSAINLFNDVFFSNNPWNGLSGMSIFSNSQVQVTYENYPGNYAFFLLPQNGLYNLHTQLHTDDSVDCSRLDTTTQLTFNRPVPFTASPYSELYGIFDTTDLSRVIAFTDDVQPYSRPGVDYEYAPIPTIQKYEMKYYATLPNTDQISIYAYGKTLPQKLLRPMGNDFSVSSAQTDIFTVTFPNTKPTYYNLYLKADSTIQYWMYVPSDSATVHPVPFLTALKSKLFPTAHANNLALKEFNMCDFNGLNYQAYYDFVTDSAAFRTHHVTSVAVMTRSYN